MKVLVRKSLIFLWESYWSYYAICSNEFLNYISIQCFKYYFKLSIFLEQLQLYKKIEQLEHIPCTHCSQLYYYGMFVTINEPRLRHSYYPRSISYSDVLHLCLIFFPCSRILSRTPHYVKSSRLLLAATVCQTSLVFDDFDSYEEYRSVILQRALLLELV